MLPRPSIHSPLDGFLMSYCGTSFTKPHDENQRSKRPKFIPSGLAARGGGCGRRSGGLLDCGFGAALGGEARRGQRDGLLDGRAVGQSLDGLGEVILGIYPLGAAVGQ